MGSEKKKKSESETPRKMSGGKLSSDELMREFLLGFIKIHILHHAAKEPVYGQEFHNELERHGYRLSFGTIYPVFHKLEKKGYLRSEKVNSGGRIRKYYTITAQGGKALKEAKARAAELVDELYEDE